MPLPNSALREFPECAFVREQASENELELGILRSFQWDQLVVATCAQCPTNSCTGGQAPVALVDLLDVFCNKQDLIE